MFKKVDISNNWNVIKNGSSDSFIDEDTCEKVKLPHCYNSIDGQSGDGMFKGKVLYQKKVYVTMDDSDKHYFLEVGAASFVSDVYVNGIHAYHNRCGYSMYRFKLDSFLTHGVNDIRIVVDNSKADDIYPLMADFSFYGGLYREIYLIETDSIHFDMLDLSRDGIYVTQKKEEDHFKLQVTGTVINERNQGVNVTLRCTLFDKEQKMILQEIQDLSLEVNHKFEFNSIVTNPHLWHGIDDPYLHEVQVEIIVNGIIKDERKLSVGFRTIEINSTDGVFLNGKHIKLNGVSRHQDFAGAGNALTREHMEQDIEIIKEVGANAVRLAHYQHHDYFYELCDKEGFLVWAEIPFISIPIAKGDNSNAKDQLERLIKQVYNHSSVFCWGIQNEITIAVENEKIYEMVEELSVIARKLDSQRFISQANIHSVQNTSKLNDLTDIVGYNLYYGWYYGEMTDLGKRLDSLHHEKKNLPILVSEYGVDTNPNYHSYTPKVKDYSEEYQVKFMDNALRTFKERPFVLGGFVWAMFDFGSEIRNEGGTKGKNQKGLVTIDRQIKKDAFYLCKAYWSKDSFIKIAGERFKNRHLQENSLVILSNTLSFELYVNDIFIEKRNISSPLEVVQSVLLSEGRNIIRVDGSDEKGQIHTDEIVLYYTNKEDSSYVLDVVEEKATVTNWFEKFDLKEIQEIVINDGYYSIYDTLEEINKNEEAKKVFIKYFGDILENETMALLKGLMTIESMSKRSRFRIPKELLGVINNELNKIRVTE